MRNSADSPILSDVVSAHLRSLEPDHLTDVLSSDRHTVKPWFNGRLDVAPPVVDLSAQGFTLIGGRLDAIGGKMVAAIVYRRRAHTINLLIAPGPAKRHPATTESVNGFNIRHWADEGMSLWAISDNNAAELEEFGNKFEAALQKGA
jgi:anti-sigma factor RsiW